MHIDMVSRINIFFKKIFFHRVRDTAFLCPDFFAITCIFFILVFSALDILSSDAARFFQTFGALSGLVAIFIYGRSFRRSLIFVILVCSLLSQYVSWYSVSIINPEWASEFVRLDRLAKLFIFVGVAWWLGGVTERVLLFWAIALFFFIISIFYHGNGLEDWFRGFEGQRVGFGIRNNQHASMLFGVSLIGLSVFYKRCCFNYFSFSFFRFSIWFSFFSICLAGVFVGQTRAVWIGLGIAMAVWFVIFFLFLDKKDISLRRIVLYCFCFLFLVALLAFLYSDAFFSLVERFNSEFNVVSLILSGKYDEIPYNSLGIRIHSWVAALQWFMEKPLLGWGGEARGIVISETEWMPWPIKEDYGHLHNFIIEVAVSYGLVGVSVVMSMMFWVGLSVFKSWRSNLIPNDIALFGVLFFAYWCFVNQFESYNSFGTGVYVHNIVLAGLITYHIKGEVFFRK